MTRILAKLDTSKLSEEELRALDLLHGKWSGAKQFEAIRSGVVMPKVQVAGVGGAALLSPLLAWASAARGIAAIQGQRLDPGFGQYEHQLACVVVAFDTEYYEFVGAHLPLALAAGVPLEAIEALWQGRDDIDPADRAIVDYVRGVVSGTVTNDQFAAIAGRMSDRAIVEFTALILNILMSIRTAQAFTDQRGFNRDDIEGMLAAARAGVLPEGRLEAYEGWFFHPDRHLDVTPE
ncbi:carboxymuconolactone decarboxylase family protein [Novosphingobium malaysiense]|uniref:Carboxymuconolactone decarboxylase-like domain-containing protein n=1 Tax=Novosphingobium malaysiense TaxID=1348853 RepID=A0A0B1ZLY6_9SPHN|nr:hypothetical protein [Novosphingobium malaysiense]KHK90354.1 hypothetical protein LK12_17305 [Novosphingobium malaysiense]